MGLKPRKRLGKPMEYWERLAKDLVIRQLIRASEVDNRSIPGGIASKRLLELAYKEDPELFENICEERDRCRRNLALFVENLTRKD